MLNVEGESTHSTVCSGFQHLERTSQSVLSFHIFHIHYKVSVKPSGMSRPSLHLFSAVGALQFGGSIWPSGLAFQTLKVFL
jgi:hypothetical protein